MTFGFLIRPATAPPRALTATTTSARRTVPKATPRAVLARGMRSVLGGVEVGREQPDEAGADNRVVGEGTGDGGARCGHQRHAVTKEPGGGDQHPGGCHLSEACGFQTADRLRETNELRSVLGVDAGFVGDDLLLHVDGW